MSNKIIAFSLLVILAGCASRPEAPRPFRYRALCAREAAATPPVESPVLENLVLETPAHATSDRPEKDARQGDALLQNESRQDPGSVTYSRPVRAEPSVPVKIPVSTTTAPVREENKDGYRKLLELGFISQEEYEKKTKEVSE